VFLPELVEDIGGVEASVVTELPGDDLESLGHGADEKLLLAGDATGVVAQVLAQLHLDRTATWPQRGEFVNIHTDKHKPHVISNQTNTNTQY
jgi:hypothetical protein